jgi:hypothetical protein
MARVRYLPEAGTPDTASQFGITFGPEPVVVTDPRILSKIAGSPFYEIVADDDGQIDPSATTGLRAVHRGRGSYSVMQGDTDQEVLPNLSKADAEAFNALSDDDKVAYVATPPAAA